MLFRLIMFVAMLVLPTVSFAGFFDFLVNPRFKDGVIQDKMLQQETVKKAAGKSIDIFSFIDNIYQAKVVKNSPDYAYIGDNVLTKKKPFSNLWESNIFPLYCASKGGKVFQWNLPVVTYGTADFVLSCEVNGQVDTAMLDFIKKDNSVYPYSHGIAYVTAEGFKQYLDKHRFYSYVDATGMVAVKALDPSMRGKKNGGTRQIPRSFRYEVALNISNKTNSPQQYDLTAMKLFVGEQVFDIEKEYSSDSSPVNWKYYQNLNINFTGRTSRFKLNPGQNFTGALKVKVPGLPTEDFESANLVITIGEHRFTGLVQKSDYDFLKEIFEERAN